MNFPRTLDNEKLNKPTWGPIPQSLKQTAGRQDDDFVVFSLKPLINKVVSLMPFPFHWVSACRLVSLQAGIHINFVMGLNRLLKTHCIPWWVDLFCQLTRCQDGDMPPCKHKKLYNLMMGPMGICFTSVAISWWGEACCLLLCFPTGTCVLRCT